MCLLASAWASAAAMELECYYIDPCGGCKSVKEGGCGKCYVESELNKRLQPLLRALPADRQVVLRMKNLSLYPEKYDPLLERAEQLGVKPEDFSLPCLFIGDALFAGDGRRTTTFSALSRPAATIIPDTPLRPGRTAHPTRTPRAGGQSTSTAHGARTVKAWSAICAPTFPRTRCWRNIPSPRRTGFCSSRRSSGGTALRRTPFSYLSLSMREEYFLGKADICLSLISKVRQRIPRRGHAVDAGRTADTGRRDRPHLTPESIKKLRVHHHVRRIF